MKRCLPAERQGGRRDAASAGCEAGRSPSLALRGSFAIGGRVLFRDLLLEAPAERWTCLLGTSGVGKSTVLRLLAGLPTGGVFDGTVEAGDGRPLAGRIAYMAQSDLLAPWLTLRDNVLLGARLRRERPNTARADAIIAKVGLAAHADKHPARLSGGMRQRTALARTLMEDRPVALLDEPFSALDARTRAEMQELAFAMLEDRTVLLVTHDPAEAARLGSVIHLMRETGLERMRAPEEPPIRAPDAAATLEAQAALLNALRTRAA